MISNVALTTILDPLVLGIFTIIALGGTLLTPIGLILVTCVSAGVAIVGIPLGAAGILYTLLNNAILPFMFAS